MENGLHLEGNALGHHCLSRNSNSRIVDFATVLRTGASTPYYGMRNVTTSGGLS